MTLSPWNRPSGSMSKTCKTIPTQKPTEEVMSSRVRDQARKSQAGLRSSQRKHHPEESKHNSSCLGLCLLWCIKNRLIRNAKSVLRQLYLCYTRTKMSRHAEANNIYATKTKSRRLAQDRSEEALGVFSINLAPEVCDKDEP